MKKNIVSTLVFVAVMGIPFMAFANDIELKGSGVKLTVPSGWTSQVDGDSATVESKDKGVNIIVTVLDAKDVDAALKEVEKELKKELGEIKPDGEATEVTLNGLKGVVQDGKAKVEGQAIDLTFAVFITPTDKAMMLLSMGLPKDLKRNDKGIEKFVESIRPAKKK